MGVQEQEKLSNSIAIGGVWITAGQTLGTNLLRISYFLLVAMCLYLVVDYFLITTHEDPDGEGGYRFVGKLEIDGIILQVNQFGLNLCAGGRCPDASVDHVGCDYQQQ